MELIFKFTKFDKILLLVFTGLAAAGFWALLNKEFTLYFINESAVSKSENIGQVLSIKNSVRQKNHSETHWRTTSQGGDIANGEMLYTDNDSGAVVKIGESKFSLGPKSLIVFRKEGLNDHLELLAGEVSGKFKDITVVAQGKKLRVDSKSSVFKLNKSKGVTVEHKDQKAKIMAPLASLADIKKLNPIELSMARLAKNYFIIGTEKSVKIPIMWKTNAASAVIKLNMLEKNGKVKSARKSIETKKGRFIASVITPGRYVVNISPSESDFVASEEFQVIHIPLPEIKKTLIEVEL